MRYLSKGQYAVWAVKDNNASIDVETNIHNAPEAILTFLGFYDSLIKPYDAFIMFMCDVTAGLLISTPVYYTVTNSAVTSIDIERLELIVNDTIGNTNPKPNVAIRQCNNVTT
ncbi:hypothetical protein CHUAL_008180 [Chamberlinius hualienensis]